MNSLGDKYNRLVSKSSHFESETSLLTLCYYPEDNGDHYLSIEVEPDYLRNCLQKKEPMAMVEDVH